MGSDYKEEEKKIPMPPSNPLYVPLDFWLDVIAYMDKRSELICKGSGHGMLTLKLKFHKKRIYEVNFSEDIRVREMIEKAGAVGSVNPDQSSVDES